MISDSESAEHYAFRLDFSSEDACEQQHIDLEMMHSEIAWLHEQVRALQQTLLYQAQQQHESNQELQATHRELALMNQEIQNLLRVNQLTFEEAQEFVQALVAKKKPAREALAKLLSLIYARTVDPGDLNQTQSSNCQAHRETPEEFTPPHKIFCSPNGASSKADGRVRVLANRVAAR